MEKKVLTDEVLYSSFLLSDVSEDSMTKTFLTEENKILKILPDEEEQHNAFRFAINQLRLYDKMDSLLLGSGDFSEFVLKNRELMEQKILKSKDFIELSASISLPTAMYYKKDGTFIGYEQEKVEGRSLYDYKDSMYNDSSLGAMLLYELTEIVEKANQLGIVFTDLSNLTNIMVTPDLCIKLIDYDDFQIGKLRSLTKSMILSEKMNPVLGTKKYVEEGIYSANFNKASLLNTMYLTLNRMELLGNDSSKSYQEAVINNRVKNFVYLEGYDYPELFSTLMDAGNEELMEATKTIFHLEKENIYPKEAIKTYAKKRNIEYKR